MCIPLYTIQLVPFRREVYVYTRQTHRPTRVHSQCPRSCIEHMYRSNTRTTHDVYIQHVHVHVGVARSPSPLSALSLSSRASAHPRHEATPRGHGQLAPGLLLLKRRSAPLSFSSVPCLSPASHPRPKRRERSLRRPKPRRLLPLLAPLAREPAVSLGAHERGGGAAVAALADGDGLLPEDLQLRHQVVAQVRWLHLLLRVGWWHQGLASKK